MLHSPLRVFGSGDNLIFGLACKASRQNGRPQVSDSIIDWFGKTRPECTRCLASLFPLLDGRLRGNSRIYKSPEGATIGASPPADQL
jgi:hypothetical protein